MRTLLCALAVLVLIQAGAQGQGTPQSGFTWNTASGHPEIEMYQPTPWSSFYNVVHANFGCIIHDSNPYGVAYATIYIYKKFHYTDHAFADLGSMELGVCYNIVYFETRPGDLVVAVYPRNSAGEYLYKSPEWVPNYDTEAATDNEPPGTDHCSTSYTFKAQVVWMNPTTHMWQLLHNEEYVAVLPEGYCGVW